MTNSAVYWRAARFRRSSFSGSSGGNCVEIAQAGTQLGLRDSKDPASPVLAVTIGRGRAFLAALKHEQITAP